MKHSWILLGLVFFASPGWARPILPSDAPPDENIVRLRCGTSYYSDSEVIDHGFPISADYIMKKPEGFGLNFNFTTTAGSHVYNEPADSSNTFKLKLSKRITFLNIRPAYFVDLGSGRLQLSVQLGLLIFAKSSTMLVGPGGSHYEKNSSGVRPAAGPMISYDIPVYEKYFLSTGLEYTLSEKSYNYFNLLIGAGMPI